MKTQRNVIPRLTWVYISGAASLFFLAAAILMIFLSPRLTEFGITKSFYYIILIPVGLASAAFLFGALRSSAKYSGKTSYGSIELTGPVVIFCLVIIGGFYFASPESDFLLTIRTVDPAKPEKMINDGTIIVDFGDQRLDKKLNENGEVMFSGVSSKFTGKPVNIFPQIKGYKIKGSNSITIPENRIIYLELTERIDSTLLRGMVINDKGDPEDSVFIDIESGIASAASDDKGRFSVVVPASAGDALLLTAVKNGTTLYRDFITVTEKGSITIKLKK
jgi:hypothetical protein